MHMIYQALAIPKGMLDFNGFQSLKNTAPAKAR